MRVEGPGCRVQGSGCRVQGWEGVHPKLHSAVRVFVEVQRGAVVGLEQVYPLICVDQHVHSNDLRRARFEGP